MLCKPTMILILGLFNGCLPVGKVNDAHRNGGGSILASIGGIDADDLASFKAENYQLICEKPDTSEVVKAQADKVSEDAISFPSQNLKDGLVCALEIRAEVSDQYNYTWYGIDEQKKPISGLYYSSNKGVINERRLSLKVMKLYSRAPADYFSAAFTVNFAGDEQLPDAVAVEAARKMMSASLECGETNYRSVAGELVENEERQRLFLIKDLSVSKMSNTTCHEIKIVVDNNDIIYRADLFNGQVTFGFPEVGSQVAFGPIEVEKYIPGPLAVELEAGASCKQFDVSTRECLAVELTRSSNFWFATVETRNAANEVGELLVTGGNGFSLDSGDRVKSLTGINASLLTAEPQFRFFDASLKAQILDKPMSSPTMMLGAAPLTSDRLMGLTITRFKDIHLHGFQRYSDETLAPASAKVGKRWLAIISASKTNVKSEFIISGASKYFNSELLSGSRFFTWDAFKANRDQFAIYTYNGAANGGLYGESCATELSYFKDVMSQRTVEQLAPTVQKPAIDACRIASMNGDMSDWQVSSEVFLWGWHRLAL